MKKISTVAIAALHAADKGLYSPNWDKRLYDTYKSWVALRGSKDNITNMNEWRDAVSSIIKGMVGHYEGTTDRANDRCYWSETFNLRVAITVMGGYRKYPTWEVDIAITPIDHTYRHDAA